MNYPFENRLQFLLKKPEGNGFELHDFAPINKADSAKELSSQNTNLLTVNSANEWLNMASKQAKPTMLFDCFWHENELCILFADTNVGKSIFAVQIADSISRGQPIQGFALEAKKQPVLYFDFELSAKQFENRYSINYAEHYLFDDGFLRAEINPDSNIENRLSFEEQFLKSLKDYVTDTECKVIIIDNITNLADGTEKAFQALPLMKKLNTIKRELGLSILVLAHTPKRDVSKPITRNDLQGSKMLINLCDSAFTIGESAMENSYRYLKQIKTRATEFIYHAENVCLCELVKVHNFLQLKFLKYSIEAEHLKTQDPDQRNMLIQQALTLAKSGVSNVEIAKKLGVSEGTIRKWKKSQNDQG